MAPEQVGLQAIFATEEFERGMARYVNALADATRRTTQAEGTMSQAGETMEGRLSAGAMAAAVAIGQILARAFEKMVEAAVAAARALFDFARESVSTASRVQELDVVLGLIGGRAGQTEAQLDGQVRAIRDLGIETATAQGLLIDFYRWNLRGEDAMRLARLAQDAAVISQQNSSEALEGLIHGITTMNTRVLRTYGITLASTVDAQDAYARSLGKTRDQLTEAEMIQAVLNAVLDQGEQIAGAYEAAMTTAGKRLRSLERHVEDLRENMGTPFLGAFTAGVDIVTAFVEALKAMTAEGMPLRAMLDGIAGVAQGFLEGVLDLFKQALPYVMIVLNERLPVMMEAFGRLGESVGKLFEALGLGRPTISDITGMIAGSIDAVTGFVNALAGAASWLADRIPQAAAAAAPFVDRLRAILTQLGEWWAQHGPAAIATIQGVLERIGPPLQELGRQIGDFIARVLDRFGAWFEENGPVIGEAMLKVQEAMAAVFGWLVEQLPSIWGIIEPILMGLVDVILGLVGALARIITGDWEGAWQSIVAGAAAAWEGIKQAIANFADWVAGWFGTSWAGIVQQWRQNWEDFKLIVGIAWQRVQEAVSEGVAGVLGWITGQVAAFRQMGQNLIDGLRQGVINRATAMVNAVRGVITDALAAARRLLGIDSPSRVFQEIGAWTMAGLAEGIAQAMSLPERAMEMAVRHIVEPAATGARQMVSGPSSVGPTTISNTTNYNLQFAANYATAQSPVSARDDLQAILAAARR